MRIFYLPLHSQTTNVATDAEIAQLVERNLAKVEVAGPSPVFRSKAKGRIFRDSPFCFAYRGDGLGTCDLKTPLPGAGGVCNNSRNRSRAARVRVPFSAPKQKGESSKILPFVLHTGTMDSAPATSKRPFQGPGVSAKFRGTARAPRECESRFPLQSRRENLQRFSLLFCIPGRWTRHLRPQNTPSRGRGCLPGTANLRPIILLKFYIKPQP